jgi:hypothetical protein
MDADTEALPLQRRIAHIEHHRAGDRIETEQPVDPAAGGDQRCGKTERIENREPARLQDQAGAERLRLAEALDQGDGVAGPFEQQRRRQPAVPHPMIAIVRLRLMPQLT